VPPASSLTSARTGDSGTSTLTAIAMRIAKPQEPEDRGGVERVDEQTAEQEADRAAGARPADHGADRVRHALRSHGVAGEAVGQRRDGCAQALDDSTRDGEPARLGERAYQRAGGECRERDEQHTALAEHVSEPADERDRHDRREHESGDQPRDRTERRTVVLRERGKRGDDERLLEAEVERTE